MSRWGRDPETAADELIGRCLETIDLGGGPVLLANHIGRLAATLADRGIAVTQWHRRLATAGPAAQAWPPTGPFDVALLRLPKARDEQEMAAHACLGALREGGRLIVYGGNDEGIRPAASLLARLAAEVETLAARGHGRVLAVRRPAGVAALRMSLSAWRIAAPIEIAGVARDWITYPGVFAAGRVDEGTALLLGALPPLRAGARVLDYGCGSGVIGAAALAREPGLSLDLLDSDAVALEAARENVPGARLILGAVSRALPTPGTRSSPTRRCTRVSSRITRCSRAWSPTRRGACGPMAVSPSSCSAACPSIGCWRGTSRTSPWPRRPPDIGSGTASIPSPRERGEGDTSQRHYPRGGLPPGGDRLEEQGAGRLVDHNLLTGAKRTCSAGGPGPMHGDPLVWRPRPQERSDCGPRLQAVASVPELPPHLRGRTVITRPEGAEDKSRQR